ncbi:MAG: apolipoprotein N-acyltransferase, partial [Thermoguttaceae bacterium]|nr:apolipoprotein N-acyltransferase [Thermoguttaceae bacterium]MDW8037441.1 apolipoprotein N-acyltransferase [Thermoguttaceae bacterium]
WVAPVPWLVLVRCRQLPGRRPYLALWTVGFLYWLVQLHWLTLPYWATSLGWIALSWYLAFYLPVFVALTRTAVHRFRVPLNLAAPVVWTGLELARGHLLTGFTMASLAHSQYRWLALIQVCDLAGAYGLGFVMMFVSACLARMLPIPDTDLSDEGKPATPDGRADTQLPISDGPLKPTAAGQWAIWPILPAAAMLAGVLCYGYWRLGEEPAELQQQPTLPSLATHRAFTQKSTERQQQPAASPLDTVREFAPKATELQQQTAVPYLDTIRELGQQPAEPQQQLGLSSLDSSKAFAQQLADFQQLDTWKVSAEGLSTIGSTEGALLAARKPLAARAENVAIPEASSAGIRRARIALVQGSIDTQIKDDPKKQTMIMEQYIRLSQEAVQRFGRVDLLVWPETMFRVPWVTFDQPPGVPEDWTGSPEQFRSYLDNSVQWGRRQVKELACSLGVPLLLGIDGIHFGANEVQFFNTALFVDAQGNLLDRYDKMHPVLFGEYVPLAKRIRFLQKLTPLGPGLTAGQRAVAVPVGQARLLACPTICYESVLPHVVRRPILMLRAEGKEPDLMVNLTNDGWFYGTIELDLHLICAVFRAVEFRKPWVIAANTGFSAWIDGSGRIRRLGPRRDVGVLLAEPQADGRRSLYLDWGDWFAGLCLTATLLVGLAEGWLKVRRHVSTRVSKSSDNPPSST